MDYDCNDRDMQIGAACHSIGSSLQSNMFKSCRKRSGSLKYTLIPMLRIIQDPDYKKTIKSGSLFNKSDSHKTLKHFKPRFLAHVAELWAWAAPGG